MAGKKENIKALFSNTRSRIIIVFTVLLIITTVVVGFVKFNKSLNPLGGASGVGRTPAGIASIPGAMNQTAQYAALQSQQNVEQAEEAAAKGTSSIPTIIRSQAFGEGVESVGATGGQGSVGFVTLARENQSGPQSTLWFQTLKETQCNKTSIDQAVNQNNASMSDLKLACSCTQLKAAGYGLVDLKSVCTCDELKALGFSIAQFKAAGFSADVLRACGFVACEEHAAGFSAQDMKDAGYTDGELKGAGFSERDIAHAGGLPDGIQIGDVQKAGCSVENLQRLRAAGVTAAAIRRISGCSAAQLKAAGFSAADLRNAGFSAAELRGAGFTPEQLKAAGYKPHDLLAAGFTSDELVAAGFAQADVSAAEAILPSGITANDISAAGCTPAAIRRQRLAGVSEQMIKKHAGCSDAELAAGRPGDCSVESLKSAKAMGLTAATLKQTLGCSADAMKQAGFTAYDLKEAGFTAAELKNAGFGVGELKAVGYAVKDLYAVGFSAADLKAAGFDAKALKDAGILASELKSVGFTAEELKDAGFDAAALKGAGFTADALRKAGYTAKMLKEAGYSVVQLKNAGFVGDEIAAAGVSAQDSALAGLEEIAPLTPKSSNLATIPSIGGETADRQKANLEAENAKHLNEIIQRQRVQQVDQRFQQKVQQRTAAMVSAANQMMQAWKTIQNQQYLGGTEKEDDKTKAATLGPDGLPLPGSKGFGPESQANGTPIVRMGDVLFAVIDTSINTDEPGPILATIVSGPLKGGKLIGTFNLPSNADKMVISFNSLSMPGAPRTMSISAFAIDPNTARTALSSETDHHYLMRYGSLFASTFLEGFGNAFQSADTTITVGGTGGVTNTTVQNGIGRSALENAVIGLATVGKAWGQVAQQNMSRPTTVQVYSGTAIGVLFTQDLSTT